MFSLITTAVHLAGGNNRLDDTITDRINHVTTTAIFVVLSVLVTTSQYVGEPIDCWCPKEFTGNQVNYANSVCWIKGTYFVSFEKEQLPSYHGRGRNPTVIYYQWVPLILLFQAFLFKVPNLFWRFLEVKSGFDLSNFVEYGEKVSSPKIKNDVQETLLDHMTIQFEKYLMHGSHPSRALMSKPPQGDWNISLKHLFTHTCFRFLGHRHLNYFSTLQFITKFLYLTNIIFQIIILKPILNFPFYRYGFDMLLSLYRQNFFSSRPQVIKHKSVLIQPQDRFPKVAMCDFKVRRLGVIQNHTVQCALSVNLFNEKIFLFLWFWLYFLLILNFISLLKWFLKSNWSRDRYQYIKNLLVMSGAVSLRKKKKKISKENSLDSLYMSSNSTQINYQETFLKKQDERSLLIYFVAKHLKQDGVLVIQILNQSTNTIVAMEIVEKLWINFREKYDKTFNIY